MELQLVSRPKLRPILQLITQVTVCLLLRQSHAIRTTQTRRYNPACFNILQKYCQTLLMSVCTMHRAATEDFTDGFFGESTHSHTKIWWPGGRDHFACDDYLCTGIRAGAQGGTCGCARIGCQHYRTGKTTATSAAATAVDEDATSCS